MKKAIIIGVACLTAGIGLAGCGAGSTTTETNTTAETTTTTAETTTTTQETTTTTQETTTTTEKPTTTTTEAPTTTANVHPENDRIMENLRNFYKSHTIVDGVPVNEDGTTKYTKFAIADFDGDGENEVAIELIDGTYYGMVQVFVVKVYNDNISDNDILKTIGYSELSDNVYLDNGIAYVSDVMIADHNSRANDGLKDRYYIINNNYYEKLNYSKDNIGDQTSDYVLSYYEQEGKINKTLHTQHDTLFNLEKTQEQYEADKALLNSGNVMDIQVKDFTAENIGL